MLMLSDLDILIAKEAFVIDVPLTVSDKERVICALTGTNPTRADIRPEIQKVAATREPSAKKQAVA